MNSSGFSASFDSSSRRQFLKGSTLGAAAVCVSPFSLFAKEKKSATPKARGCTLGFSTYGMKSLPTEKALTVLSEIGFDAVELAVRTGWDADSAKLGKKRRQAIRKQLQDLPLRLTSLMEHVFPTDDRNQAEALKRLKLAAELAHELSPENPPLIQTVLGGGDFEKIKNPMLDRLAEWVKVADATQTTIAIKPHRGGGVSKPSEAVWLIEQLDKPPRLRMVYDYSHYAFRGLPLTETIQTALPYTAHIAVKDAVQEKGRVRFDLPGQAGTIDFPELIRQFDAGGYQGDFNCEVSGHVSGQPGYDSITAAKTCYTNMSAAFQKSGVSRAEI
ncbi:MAG: sugar phosphate isomerase/epimerase [Planctomycetaceae bacterium]|nr:sugar phosphate isomerase/epimerase [Planctomycetaceae bacterium]